MSPADPAPDSTSESTPELGLVYEELRSLAVGLFRRQSPAHTLQPTALVHEVWLKLARAGWNDQQHFLALAATAMRQVLTDHARRARADKRGAGAEKVTLDESADSGASAEVELLALEDTLQKLGQANPRFVRVFELRYLAGMNTDAVAKQLDVTPRTVQLDWRAIRAFLNRELTGAE
jgi:RNA polymerase sigma factor (TIGR02999 family)